MLKIDPIMNSLGKYCRKSTVNAKYNRNLDIATVSGVGTAIQFLRLPSWGIHDIGITAFLGTIALKESAEAFKNRIELSSIIKRAKSIKKASKNNQ